MSRPRTCECCDHPLQHVIRDALNVYENELFSRRVPAMIATLRDGLAAWEAERV